MPLKQSSSKKAFQHNVEAEMHSGKPQDQSLAIAYSVKRKNKRKKMAEGGAVNESAKSEHRPMPNERDKDAKMVSRNSGNKPPGQDSWTSRPDIAQSQRGPKTTPIKHPRMVASNIVQSRLRDEEDHLMDSSGPNNGPQRQPPEHDNEIGADRQGPDVSDMEREHSNGRKPYAKGGPVMEPKDRDIQLMERQDEADMQSRLSPSEDEGEAEARSRNEERPNRQGPDVPALHMKRMAHGGMAHEMDDQPEEEAEMEHEDSIAAAIMAKKERQRQLDSGSADMDHALLMYEGGQIEGSDESMADIMLNGEEHPNGYYPRNEDEVLKENYMEDMRDVSQPDDSNELGDSREDDESDPHDMVDKIRSQMNKRRQFKDR